MRGLELKIKLFGTPAVWVDGRKILLPYKKADAVLYCTALKGTVSRVRMAELLWPDAPAETGLKNLRHAIYSIRKACGENLFQEQKRAVLSLDPGVTVSCDVTDLLQGGKSTLYTGDFLEGFRVPSSDVFENWVQEKRRHYRALYQERLLREAGAAFADRNLEEAERDCLLYMQTEPAEEDAVRLLMSVYREKKQFQKAIEVYQDLCRTLSEDFGIAPLSETTALYYRILDEWNDSAGEEKVEHLILGKDKALRALRELSGSSPEHGACRCLLLQGGAGVGKTWLVDYFLRNMDRPGLFFRSACYQTETGIAMAPWNPVMMEVGQELSARKVPVSAQSLSQAAALFPALLPAREKADSEYPGFTSTEEACRNAIRILGALSRELPLLLIFEDIHWMDESSAYMLAMLLRHLQNIRISVICTVREEMPEHIRRFIGDAVRDKVLTRRRLQPFSREETGKYLDFYAKTGMPEESKDLVYRHTDGNPLLLSQLASSIREEGDASLAARAGHIIEYRLAALGEEEKRILELLSVFLDPAPFEAMEAVLRMNTMELTWLVSQLVQKRFLLESVREGAPEYALVHEQMRSVIAAGQSISLRRMLYLRVAEYIRLSQETAGDPDYEKLAYYYEQGGDRFHSFRCRILSLEKYVGVYYELMPVLSGRPGGGFGKENPLLDYYGRLESTLENLRVSCFGEQAGELPGLEMKLMLAEARYYIHEGLYEKGERALERLLLLSRETGDRIMEISAHQQYIFHGIQVCDTELMRRHVEMGLLLSGEDRISAETGIFLRLKGLCLLTEGHYKESREILLKAIRTFGALEHADEGRYAIHVAGCYNYLAESFRLRGDYPHAFSFYEKALYYNQKKDYYPGAAVFYTNYGTSLFQAGQKERAREMFLRAEVIYRGSYEYSAYPVALSYLALYDEEDGRDAEAAEKLERALEICRKIGSGIWMGITLYLMWRIRIRHEESGRRQDALEALWPGTRKEHCLKALSYLRRCTPGPELAFMEKEYKKTEKQE